MFCQSKCGLYGHYDCRVIDCPLNVINIHNKDVVKDKIMPVMEEIYKEPNAKKIEEIDRERRK
eukprot:9928173-Ditylum_brightwellii.AAC.1